MTRRLKAWWPIENSWTPPAVRRAEASREVDAIAAELGATIGGEVKWYVQDGYLFATADARPLPRTQSPAQRAALVRMLAEVREHPDRRIADLLGCSEAAIAKVRAAQGIDPAEGFPRCAGRGPAVVRSAAAGPTNLREAA